MDSAPKKKQHYLEKAMCESLPKCPLCKSDLGYQFSGIINKFAQCKQCKAKWWIQYWGGYIVELVEVSSDGIGSFLLDKKHDFSFWQNLNLEAQEQAEEIKTSMKNGRSSLPTEYFDGLLNILKEKGIVLEKLECPNCGGIIRVSELPGKEEIIECKYCGKSILATNLFKRYMDQLHEK